ncbi:MAG: isoprenylcysteine carboxylmethyltransferase family protein [Anaerolineae bacterium]|nr:isoprenylcysteine carboxylmethyltransferase family protein [Thermoflexales bacterium]MDW8407369.1 isoprenylcysteine carboxylmethyltransferase family protein [Anaerolineae bacterium]
MDSILDNAGGTKRRFGARGEWWVVAQFTLGPAFVVTTWLTRGRAFDLSTWSTWIGIVLAAPAAALVIGGILSLGRNLTPLPAPVEDGALVDQGLYCIVRHPIYSGIIFAAVAWALMCGSVLGLFLSIPVFVFFDLKSRREEAWLAEKYPAYADYRRRVRKLIPFLY